MLASHVSEPARPKTGPCPAPARRLPPRLALALLVCSMSASCRHAAEPRSTPTASDTYRAGQPAMRSPDRRTSPGAQRLGTLSAVEPNASAGNVAREPAAVAGKPTPEPPPLITVADDARRQDVGLRDGTLSVPGGLLLHRIPKGVAVRTVSEQRTGEQVWEFVDARGRKLALLKAERAGRAALRDDALERTDDARARRNARWGKSNVPVVTERFRGETHVYTIDRRATGTEWIWSGLELAR